MKDWKQKQQEESMGSVYGKCQHGNNMANCDECDAILGINFKPEIKIDPQKVEPKFKINPYVYFVERKDNHLWIAEIGDTETYNPTEAKQFKTIEDADKYIADNNLSKWYYATEHEWTITLP